MASWLKAAEDLFEVVDRRAKLVVSELSEEQMGATGSNGQGSQAKKPKSRVKGNKRTPANNKPTTDNSLQDKEDNQVLQVDAKSDKDNNTSSLVENDGNQTESPSKKTARLEEYHEEVLPTHKVTEAEAIPSTSNSEIIMADPLIASAGNPPSPLQVRKVEETSEDNHVDALQPTKVEDADVQMKVDQESTEPATTDDTDGKLNDADEKAQISANKKQDEHKADNSQLEHKADNSQLEHKADNSQPEHKAENSQLEHKSDNSRVKLQDPLDEAQVLLKTAVSTGQSKEARLSRVCNGLATRLQEYKSENAQLEELLTSERELTKSYEAHIKQLQQDVSASKHEVTRIESSMAEALAAKNSEIEALINTMDSLKKQLALSEGNLASVQANMESLMRNRELTETTMMQALREELASAERRAEEERAAHNATKMASREREVELEHRALDASTALARIQRVADERTAKAAELEQKLALYEVENASLTQELEDMKTIARRGQKKSPEETNQVIQMQAWQEEAERARQGQRDAESKLSTLEAEVQKMRVEMAAMKRDAEHYSRQEHMELEKRYRELTDLLYYKQTQLEAMASEKAAAEFHLEKELKRLQEVQVEAERSRVSRRASSSSWEEDSEMKALEPLPLHHRHMAAASVQLQKAAKLLDSGAVRATRFLWRYPTARVILLFYLVFVHLFLMYLLHRLQEQADNFSAREVAESMGLATPNLP